MESLEFVTNIGRREAVQFMRRNSHVWYEMGEPQSTVTYSSENLKEMGMVGIYWYKNTC